jgi:hypothetical protein
MSENQRDLVRSIFLVAPDALDQLPPATRQPDFAQPDRKPGIGEMRNRPLGVGGRAKTEFRGEAEGERDPERDRFAMEQGPEASLGLDRMGEAMAQVEQRPLPRPVGNIPRNDPRLRPNRRADRLLPEIAMRGKHAAAVGLAPGEKCGIVDQAIFDDLGVTGPHLALVERVEEGRIGHNQRGLMKCPDQILFTEGVDRGLAADRAVGLRQEGGRHVDDRAPPLEQGCGEPGDIADASAAQCNYRRVARYILFGKGSEKRPENIPVFRRFPLRNQDGIRIKRFGNQCAVKRKYPRLTDHQGRGVSGQVPDALDSGRHRADKHVIAVWSGFHPNDGHAVRCWRKAVTIASTTSW